MSTTALAPTPARPTITELRPTHWHRPLLVLAAVMATLAVANIVGAIIDPRQVTGADVWLKPLKFALSTGIYSLALAWLIGRIPLETRLARIASICGTIAAVGLAVELTIVDGFALVGQSSHFNVSTPFHTAMWGVMAISIAVVWCVTLVIAIALFRVPLGDAARTLGIRAGVVIALSGMALGALMTGPTPGQLSNFQGIAGAHTVGLPDGGPGLPLLGWSTVGGDLRIPHFVGMHALQALPLLVLLLEILTVRVAVLRDPQRRFRIVLLAVAIYAATLAILTAQALSGQSIVAPSGGILVGGILTVAIAAAGLLALVVAPVGAGRPHPVH
ncbi:MAG: hypothetical protein ABIS08_04120 [Pseudolysinimonas sp.]